MSETNPSHIPPLRDNCLVIRFPFSRQQDRLDLLHLLASDPYNYPLGKQFPTLYVREVEFSDSYTFCILNPDVAGKNHLVSALIEWFCSRLTQLFVEPELVIQFRPVLNPSHGLFLDVPPGSVYPSAHTPGPRASFVFNQITIDYCKLEAQEQTARTDEFKLRLRGVQKHKKKNNHQLSRVICPELVERQWVDVLFTALWTVYVPQDDGQYEENASTVEFETLERCAHAICSMMEACDRKLDTKLPYISIQCTLWKCPFLLRDIVNLAAAAQNTDMLAIRRDPLYFLIAFAANEPGTILGEVVHAWRWVSRACELGDVPWQRAMDHWIISKSDLEYQAWVRTAELPRYKSTGFLKAQYLECMRIRPTTDEDHDIAQTDRAREHRHRSSSPEMPPDRAQIERSVEDQRPGTDQGRTRDETDDADVADVATEALEPDDIQALLPKAVPDIMDIVSDSEDLMLQMTRSRQFTRSKEVISIDSGSEDSRPHVEDAHDSREAKEIIIVDSDSEDLMP